MKIIAMGANLPSKFGTPAQTLSAALNAMEEKGIHILKHSRIWKTAPVPFDPAQPWYHNAVVEIQTALAPHDLLKTLLTIEEGFGRIRTIKNAPRLLDLDLIAYDALIIADRPDLIVPHPRMNDRAFVLLPLSDIAPEWVHPQTGWLVDEMIAAIPNSQMAEPVDGPWDDA